MNKDFLKIISTLMTMHRAIAYICIAISAFDLIHIAIVAVFLFCIAIHAN